MAAMDASPVAAGEGDEFVAFGALGHFDAVPVAPLFDLGFAPDVEDGVAEGLRGGSCAGRNAAAESFQLVADEAAIAADGGDELVAVCGLGDGDPALVAPRFEFRLGPGLVQPIAWVGGRFAELVGDELVVLAGFGEERVVGRWLRVGDAVTIEEGFELGFGPTARVLSVSTRTAGHGGVMRERTYQRSSLSRPRRPWRRYHRSRARLA